MNPSERVTIKAVLFDAVGTLICPDPPVDLAYVQAGSRHGSRLKRTEIRSRFGTAFKKYGGESRTDESFERRRWQSIVNDVFTDVTDTEPLFNELWIHFGSHHNWSLFDDVAAVWKDLEARGIAIGIATNFDSRFTRFAPKLVPLDRARHTFVSSLIGAPKPVATFYRAIQDKLGLSGAEILMVGDDRANDYAGPRAAGWHSLLLARSTDEPTRPAIASLDQVIAYLDSRQPGSLPNRSDV